MGTSRRSRCLSLILLALLVYQALVLPTLGRTLVSEKRLLAVATETFEGSGPSNARELRGGGGSGGEGGGGGSGGEGGGGSGGGGGGGGGCGGGGGGGGSGGVCR